MAVRTREQSMKFSLVTLLCGLLWMAAIAQAQADEVDDLLAGKPVATDEPASQPGPAASLDERFSAPFEPAPLTPGTSWEVATTSRTRLSASTDAADQQPPAPSASVTMVPEPQAIALAALALLYFLIFFRRRHLA
jgi:hypothetical protein